MPVNSPEQFGTLVERLLDGSETIGLRGGRENEFRCYQRWASRSGAELWVPITGSNEALGVNPHFAGESIVRVGLINRLLADPGSGAFYGWAQPEGDDPKTGCYPFVFEAPDFCCHDDIVLPAIVEVQIAAFAHELSVFSSEEDFSKWSANELKFASRSFVPSGLFSAKETNTPPKAHAILTGHILKTEYRTNEATGAQFMWAKVDTYGGIFDVVADLELVNAVPKVGGVLTGSFWLSGRVKKPANKKP
jgi:hypothetical protein